MSLFGAIIRTAVNVTTLPINVIKDTVMSVADLSDNELPGSRTIENIKRIKDEAES
jgi:hypothetical protein